MTRLENAKGESPWDAQHQQHCLSLRLRSHLRLCRPAKEYYVGEPVAQNEMKIIPHYLLGIEMAPMPKGAKSMYTRQMARNMVLKRTNGLPA
jgi:hypothetical protein